MCPCVHGKNIVIMYADLTQMTMLTSILITYAIRLFMRDKNSSAIMKFYSSKQSHISSHVILIPSIFHSLEDSTKTIGR
jgi:hypothetical protein